MKSTIPFLTFRYLRNVTIFLGDGRQYIIPMTMKEVPTDKGPCVQPVFDLSVEHKVELADEAVRVPKKQSYVSDRRYETILDAAHEKAQKAMETNDLIRKSIHDYVLSGDIEVTYDPFALEMEEDDLVLSEMKKVDETLAQTNAVELPDATVIEVDHKNHKK